MEKKTNHRVGKKRTSIVNIHQKTHKSVDTEIIKRENGAKTTYIDGTCLSVYVTIFGERYLTFLVSLFGALKATKKKPWIITKNDVLR